MSRVANNPIALPGGVEVKLDGSNVTVKGGKGSLGLSLAEGIEIKQEDNELQLSYANDKLKA